ncbi:MAG: hypothetical protein AB3N28_00685 [Kordiimonas sp.]
MISFFRTIVLMVCLIGLSACTENIESRTYTDLEGTKLTIKTEGEEYYLTIGSTQNQLVTSEATNWKNELLYKNEYYRGFLLYSRQEGDYHWKLDIDLSQVDALFPMEVGVAAEVTGEIIDLVDQTRAGYRAEINIIAEKALVLPSGTYTAYQVKLTQHYETPEGTKTWRQVVYHCPELKMNMKGSYISDGEKKYWRIVKIENLDTDMTPAPPARPRRRNGTVMI